MNRVKTYTREFVKTAMKGGRQWRIKQNTNTRNTLPTK